MKTHELKYKGKDLCDAVYEGRKTYEIRKNDRNYEVGDVILPIPIDKDLNPIDHPISKCIYEITFISEGYPGVETGYCVFSTKCIS